MANTSQAPDLEGIHREMYEISEHIRIMNEINACLVQYLTTNNPPLTTALVPKDVVDLTTQKFKDLDAWINAINIDRNAPVTVDTLIRQTEPPFTERGCSDEVMCKAFSATLKGPARSWFKKLSPRSIDSFGDLIHQKDGENLKDYVKRLNQTILEVEDPIDNVVIMAMMEGLRPGPLFDYLSKSVPETLSTLQSKADKYITTKELVEAKYVRRRVNERRHRTPPHQLDMMLPPLNAHIAQMLMEIKNEDFVKWPGQIKPKPLRRNKNKYYEFYKKYVADCLKPDLPDRGYVDNKPNTGDIQTIHGGFGLRGCSNSSRKRHAREANMRVKDEVYNLSKEANMRVKDEVYNLSKPMSEALQPITFTNEDLRYLHLPHDALVISATIAKFNKMRIRRDKLHPSIPF
ncbi:hypothetical protein Acr_07g0013280 [Actinidia rufa]|uniref:Retrotransposon gag domain-containing protein n=1 Tax=Actinidia rufa TaxID=165716 RepID=A0A7J0EXH4_9ERIC|nr:hypothetical protein Acr_07g0013280 [Actinidia rufa]